MKDRDTSEWEYLSEVVHLIAGGLMLSSPLRLLYDFDMKRNEKEEETKEESKRTPSVPFVTFK